MSFDYDPTTTRGQVRLLCRDVLIDTYLFEDAEIDTFLTLCSNNVLLSAAMALENIAMSEVLIQKRIKLLDLETDGPAESVQLRQVARTLRQQNSNGVSGVDSFDWAEMVLDKSSYLAKVYDMAWGIP